jgi:hypothetical protein
MLTVIPGEGSGHEGGKKDGAASLIDEIVREGARRMLAEALQAEVDAYIAQHLRTTNPIESTFATVRHRTKVTKGPGSRAAGLAMAFELIELAQDRWRAVNAPHLVALVRTGATLINGKLVERAEAGAEHREAAA